MSAAPKFTPGPWRFTGAHARRILVNVHGGRITYTDDDTSAANERLIAAAPELYEALRELVAMIVEQGAGPKNMFLANAQAALAKVSPR